MPHLPYSELPAADPGTPPLRSPQRYLGWLARRQRGILIANAFFGIGWMVCQALVWAAVGAAIDHGMTKHSTRGLFIWVGVVLLLGALQALFGALRHQLAVTNWMHAAFRSTQLISRRLSDTTTAMTDEVAPGDIVTTVVTDAMRVGGAFDSLARFLGSIAAWAVVSGILLATSLQLGLIVIIGVPVLMTLTTPLMRPLHRAQAQQREASGRLAALASDTVTGLRVLRGVGGEDVFFDQYAKQNELVRNAGWRIATPSAALDSGQIFLPAILTVTVTFIGANDVQHHTLLAGQLVSFFGYTTFLTTPLRTAIEYVISFTRAQVGSAKVLRLLKMNPATAEPENPRPWPANFAAISDARSGVTLPTGAFVGLVSADTGALAPLVDRLGRFSNDLDGVSVDDTPLRDVSRADVRSHVVVSEVEPRLFSGPLRDELDSRGTHNDDAIIAALDAASAGEILEQLEGGLNTWVDERGRSFSGGQRQRLSLARAYLTEAPVLLLVEPTSAVDTHTERRIAERLRPLRQGATTVVVSASPLVLEQTDLVYLLEDGRVVASGAHHDLATRSDLYRRIVFRTDDE